MRGDSMWPGNHFAFGAFDLHCHVGRMDEALCGINGYSALLIHEVRTNNRNCQVPLYEERFNMTVVSMPNSSVFFAVDFSKWTLLT